MNQIRRFIAGIFLFASMVSVASLSTRADDWPQWRGEHRDGLWRETGILEKFPAGGPKVLWRKPVGGGYAGPTVSGGRVFVIDRVAQAAASQPANPMDQSLGPGVERVLCLNETDGKILWTHSYDCPYTISFDNGPRATPVVDGDRVYTLGAQGHLKCLNVNKGDVLWEKSVAGPNGTAPTWGFAGHPLIDGQKIICLTANKNAIVAAFDKTTGQPLWSALPADDPGYAPPMLYDFGGQKQLIIWHPVSVNALDPDTGKILWTQPFGPVRNGVSIVAPTKFGDDLFVTSFWDGSLLLHPEKDSVRTVWKRAGTPPKRTEALHSLMSPPFHRDGYIYGVCASGQLRCIDARNGDTMWETMAATTNGDLITNTTAFLMPNGNNVFIANDNGELIIAKLSPKGYEQIDRATILEPTQRDGRRKVLWSHPAFANRAMLWRNDKEIVRVDLSAPAQENR